MTQHQTTLGLSVAVALLLAGELSGAEPPRVPVVVEEYCVSCHSGPAAKGGLDLASIADQDVGRHPQVWEKVVRRLRGRQMPPDGKKRPDEDTYASVVSQLETALRPPSRTRDGPRRSAD